MTDNISEVDSHITKKYEIKKRLGKGSNFLINFLHFYFFKKAYGIVWKAINRKTGEVVAVKKIFDAFRNQTDAQVRVGFDMARTFREIMFLQEFGNHPNVIKLLDVLKADNDRDIYLVFEFMETDLHNVIKRGNILKDIHKRYIMYQLFKATKYLHSGNVLHRDQKPSNILLDADCFVKIADFGLARSLSQIDRDDQGDPALTEYVATRWYRAPEILLASKKYTKGIDTWSLGCILGEMILGKPLFPGTSTLNQIEKIMSAVQPPSKADIDSICSGYALSLMERASNKTRCPLRDLLPNSPEDALDLLNKLLHFNPERRLTAEQALEHPYVARFHNAAEEQALNYDVLPPLSDSVQLTVDEYRNKLYEMIHERKMQERRRRLERQHISRQVQGIQRPASATTGTGDNARMSHSSTHARHKSVSECTNRVRSGSVVGVHAKVPGGFLFGTQSRVITPTRLKSYEPTNNTVCVHNNPVVVPLMRPHRNLSAPSATMSTSTTKAAGAVGSRNSVVLRDHRANCSKVTTSQLHVCRPALSTVSLQPAPSKALAGTRDKTKPMYGKKQFGNYSNVSSVGAPKASLHSYSQSHGTITASGLNDLRQFQLKFLATVVLSTFNMKKQPEPEHQPLTFVTTPDLEFKPLKVLRNHGFPNEQDDFLRLLPTKIPQYDIIDEYADRMTRLFEEIDFQMTRLQERTDERETKLTVSKMAADLVKNVEIKCSKLGRPLTRKFAREFILPDDVEYKRKDDTLPSGVDPTQLLKQTRLSISIGRRLKEMQQRMEHHQKGLFAKFYPETLGKCIFVGFLESFPYQAPMFGHRFKQLLMTNICRWACTNQPAPRSLRSWDLWPLVSHNVLYVLQEVLRPSVDVADIIYDSTAFELDVSRYKREDRKFSEMSHTALSRQGVRYSSRNLPKFDVRRMASILQL
uniref:Protein kinase domain-containing protein n=1 Tax=Strigamia maritima TaxID=126957 RepID=T1J086_STRMM